MLGDSKTADDSWRDTLVASLRNESGTTWTYDDLGVPGASVASASVDIANILAGAVGKPTAVLCNWGANDMTALPAEATWKADYLTILDAVNAKWPDATVYISYPWRQGSDADAATLHAWIDDIVAVRAFARVADDEAVWLKGADDGATMTSDGIHYSVAGNAEKAAQMVAALGY